MEAPEAPDGTPALDLPVPSDPRGSFEFGGADVSLPVRADPVRLRIEAANLPEDWGVQVHVVPERGARLIIYNASPVDEQRSVWHAEFVPPRGFATVQARAYRP